ncbi:COG4280 domain-containing protein [Nocardioides sp.]|uniref:COG4280 domain-containing protein n=1 Tax=Nocardioides sp. TaxID=35761 RepID=UPI0039E2B0B8
MTAATWGLLAAAFLACFVEMVEAATIVMAMGFSRSWRSTLFGVAVALGALAVVTVVAGYAITSWLPETALQLVVGTLLLVFGLQWLRKAILRGSGRKAMHDEDQIYADEVAAARAAGEVRAGLDLFSFLVSFKGVFLEGVEVVFIVITFGLNADGDHGVLTAAGGAAAAGLIVLGLAIVLRRPLAQIPENLLKYGVGLLLATFGTFWAVEGLGLFRDGKEAVAWPGADLAIPVILLAWFGLSRVFIAALRRPGGAGRAPATTPTAQEVAR